MNELIIDTRFNGPPSSGNGGYCSGLFANQLLERASEASVNAHSKATPHSAIEVTLRNPLPLDQSLTVKIDDEADINNGINVYHDNTELANVRFDPTGLNLDDNPIPEPPTFEEAEIAGSRFTGFSDHPFSHCFVCGPDREKDDGLRIFTGATDDALQVAAIWDPRPLQADNLIADKEGNLHYPMIWAALDCPSYFGAYIGKDNTPALLGRQTLKLQQQNIAAGQTYIVTAWPIASSGRKHLAGTALFSKAGECLAYAKTTWISIA